MLYIKSTFYILFLSSSLLFAQSTISGRVFDSETQEPLPYANVFLSKTTIGTSSDLDGYFRLEDVPNGSYELVVQYLGYELGIFKVTISEKKSFRLTVRLKPKPIEGKEIVIEAPRDKFWKNCFEKFKEEFLGVTENARKSTIMNPLSLNFDRGKNRDTYEAWCDSWVIVENRGLGYKINVVLVRFRWDKITCSHKVYTQFSELEPEDEEEYRQWLENREESYKGSFKHFFSSLATYHRDIFDYKIFLMNEKLVGGNVLYYPLPLDTLYSKFISDSIGFKKLVLEDYLRISYNDGSKEIDAGIILRGKEKYILFDKFGTVVNPIHIDMYEYWAFLRWADLLPDDYRPVINNN
jgi:hypothetical protein